MESLQAVDRIPSRRFAKNKGKKRTVAGHLLPENYINHSEDYKTIEMSIQL